MPVGNFLSGKYEKVREELEEMKASCRKAPLKVIIESGVLPSASEIKKASVLAMSSGADFIKTSTGKTAVSATPEATYVMSGCQSMACKNPRKVGIKVAGGIVTSRGCSNTLYHSQTNPWDGMAGEKILQNRSQPVSQ